jgi:hypothetical protein
MIELRRQQRSLSQEMHRVSEKMNHILSQKGVDRLETNAGMLVRKQLNDGDWEWTLEL